MPAVPIGTKKALDDVSKVFNRLASELARELGNALREIEILRKEVARLKSTAGRSTSGLSSARRKTTVRTSKARTRKPSPAQNESDPLSEEQTRAVQTMANEESSYIFPKEASSSSTTLPDASTTNN